MSKLSIKLYCIVIWSKRNTIIFVRNLGLYCVGHSLSHLIKNLLIFNLQHYIQFATYNTEESQPIAFAHHTYGYESSGHPMIVAWILHCIFGYSDDEVAVEYRILSKLPYGFNPNLERLQEVNRKLTFFPLITAPGSPWITIYFVPPRCKPVGASVPGSSKSSVMPLISSGLSYNNIDKGERYVKFTIRDK